MSGFAVLLGSPQSRRRDQAPPGGRPTRETTRNSRQLTRCRTELLHVIARCRTQLHAASRHEGRPAPSRVLRTSLRARACVFSRTGLDIHTGHPAVREELILKRGSHASAPVGTIPAYRRIAHSQPGLDNLMSRETIGAHSIVSAPLQPAFTRQVSASNCHSMHYAHRCIATCSLELQPCPLMMTCWQVRGSAMIETGDRILRLCAVLDRTALSRSTLYRKVADGSFPRQVKISRRCCGWRESAVEEWLSNPR
jgi:prophage regulatory protein